jgi:RNA polymerase sigma factor (TIGR02999 family)
VPRIYGELRQLAASCLRGERSGHSLQLTGLVHETYLRLIDQDRIDWRARAQFFGVAVRLMRRILVDHARRRSALRRGDGYRRVALDGALDLSDERAPELLALDTALSALEKVDEELHRLVELRYFGGLSNREIAEVLGISEATLARRWRVAKAWLYQHLTSGSCGDAA